MMLNWLRNKIWNRRRLLFRFHDGKRIRRVDPLAAAIALHAHPAYLPRHLGEAVDGDKDALQIVAKAASDVFGIAPLVVGGNGGMTLQERLEIMLAFDAYLGALKKNIARPLTSPHSTAQMSPESPAATTNNTSVSG